MTCNVFHSSMYEGWYSRISRSMQGSACAPTKCGVSAIQTRLLTQLHCSPARNSSGWPASHTHHANCCNRGIACIAPPLPPRVPQLSGSSPTPACAFEPVPFGKPPGHDLPNSLLKALARRCKSAARPPSTRPSPSRITYTHPAMHAQCDPHLEQDRHPGHTHWSTAHAQTQDMHAARCSPVRTASSSPDRTCTQATGSGGTQPRTFAGLVGDGGQALLARQLLHGRLQLLHAARAVVPPPHDEHQVVLALCGAPRAHARCVLPGACLVKSL